MDLQKMKYKLFESHVVYKACEFYKNFKGNVRYCDLVTKHLPELFCISPFKDKDYIMNTLEYFTRLAMVKEMLTLLDEVYLKHNIDFNDPDVKEVLAGLRKKLPDKLKSLDNFQTIKMIRDSFVHNSEDVHNFKFEYGNLFKVKLHHKLLDNEDCFINLTVNDLFSIVYIYDESRILNNGDWGYLDIKDGITSVQDLLDSYKKYGNFNSVMTVVDKNGNKIDFDKYQNKAMFQYLVNHKKDISEYSKKFNLGIDYFVARFAPLRDNSLNNYEFKINYTDNLTLMALDRNLTAEQLAEQLKKEYPPRYIHIKNSKLYDSVLYSTLAYSIFTQLSRDDLKKVVDKGETKYSAEEISHIRNAFVHGRYFYNYNNGFELYDGNKDLQHIKTLTYDNIVDILRLINNEIKNKGPISIDYSMLRG